MSRNFASLPLARLYEKQGYIDDALEMYQAVNTDQNPDARDIFESISRLEAQKQAADLFEKKSLNEPGPDGLASGRTGSSEAGIACLLEKWLRLVVMQKRVDIFKSIKARI